MSQFDRCRRLVGAGIALGVTAAGLSLAPDTPGTPTAAATTGDGSVVHVTKNNIWITDGDGSLSKRDRGHRIAVRVTAVRTG